MMTHFWGYLSLYTITPIKPLLGRRIDTGVDGISSLRKKTPLSISIPQELLCLRPQNFRFRVFSKTICQSPVVRRGQFRVQVLASRNFYIRFGSRI